MRDRHARLVAAAAAITLAATPALASAGPVVAPAYYEGTVRKVMMSPSSNSANANQVQLGCFSAGPDFSSTSRSSDVPLFYALFVPGATQMSCGDGTRTHDMVLTAVPGSPGFDPAVEVVRCIAGPNFSVAGMPYTSAAAVEAGIAAEELSCVPTGRILLTPVVG